MRLADGEDPTLHVEARVNRHERQKLFKPRSPWT